MSVTVVVPINTKNPTNTREHWAERAKRVKAQRAAVGLMLRANCVANRIEAMFMRLPWTSNGLVVALARVSPRAMDDDGAIAALKHVRDEVAAYFGVNDNDPRIAWRYAQAKGKACVRIELSVVAKTEAA